MSKTNFIGYGSGNPAGLPDFRPLNPWDRPMPRRERRRTLRGALYQAFAECRDGTEMAVSPKWSSEEAALNFAEAFNKHVIDGLVKEFGLASVRKVREAKSTRTIGDILRGR